MQHTHNTLTNSKLNIWPSLLFDVYTLLLPTQSILCVRSMSYKLLLDTFSLDTVEAHCCIICECRGFYEKFHAI